MEVNKKSILSSIALRNAYKNLKGYKSQTVLSLLGFTIGLVCFIVLFSFYKQENDYDTFHEKYENIYRVNQFSKGQGGINPIAKVPFPLGPTLVNDYPDVKQVRLYQTFRKTPFLVNKEHNTSFYEKKMFFTDSTFFDVFTFKLKQGNANQVLKDPESIVLTESISKKIFKGEDPMNKLLWLEGKMQFRVTGILEDPPANSHFQFDILASIQNLDKIFEATGNTFSYDGWYWTSVNTYIYLPEGYEQIGFEKELEKFKVKHLPEEFNHVDKYTIQPIHEIHLGANLSGELGQNRSKSNVYLFLYAGIIILLIVIINYINISTSQSLGRLKELTIKRVLGAGQKDLILQIMTESFIIVALSFCLSLCLSTLFLPWFNSLLDSNLTISYLLSVHNLVIYGFLILLISISAGLYPALYSVKMAMASSVKSGFMSKSTKKQSVMRQVLVVFQFGVSSLMILFTIVIYSQYSLLINKELGFDKEEIYIIPIRGTVVKERINIFKEKLLNSSKVFQASTVSDILGQKTVRGRFKLNDNIEEVNINMLSVDFDFIKTFNLSLVEGRGFNRKFATDSIAYIINESALKLFPEQNWQNGLIEDNQIIGVVKDFHYASLLGSIEPLVLQIDPDWANYLAIKIDKGDIASTMNTVGQVWKEFEPYRPLNGFFLDDKIQQTYKNEEQLRSILSAFSFIALILACLGLFSLVTYTMKYRLKEVGIRKVLGSSTKNIYLLLVSDFVKLVVIAIIISFSIGIYFIREWLAQFPYKVEMSAIFFVISFITSLLVALAAISHTTFKVSSTKPVKILRNE